MGCRTLTRNVACFARRETCCMLENGDDDGGGDGDGDDAFSCEGPWLPLISVTESARKVADGEYRRRCVRAERVGPTASDDFAARTI